MTQEPIWQPSDISLEAAAEGDGPKRRGRIPQAAWPRILEMYKGGATLSAIAREFECTPSAISYIIRKAETGEIGPGEQPGTDAPDERPAPVAAPTPRPEQQDLPIREARPERPERRPLTMGAPEPAPTPQQARPQGEPRQGARHQGERPAVQPPQQGRPPEIRHSDGRPADARPADARPSEARPSEARPAEPRGPEQRGPEQRGADQRGPDQRGPDQRMEGRHRHQQGHLQEPRQAEPRQVGEGRGDQRGFANRPPREEARPYRENRFAQEEPDDGSDIGRFNRPSGHAAYPYRQQRNPGRQEAQETPTEPADTRMEAASKTCADLYRTWKANGGEDGMQALSDALHEMRKVIARMEIEMSASRREEQRPAPIPSYRLTQPAPQQPRG